MMTIYSRARGWTQASQIAHDLSDKLPPPRNLGVSVEAGKSGSGFTFRLIIRRLRGSRSRSEARLSSKLVASRVRRGPCQVRPEMLPCRVHTGSAGTCLPQTKVRTAQPRHQYGVPARHGCSGFDYPGKQQVMKATVDPRRRDSHPRQHVFHHSIVI